MKKVSVSIPCLGYEIAADLYGEPDESVLLVLTGFTGSKKRREPLMKEITKKSGVPALVVDYAGHGESPFDVQDVTIADNFSDVVRAYDWIAENYPNAKISVLGTSYGSYFAAQLAGIRKLQKLIMIVPAMYDPRDVHTPLKKLDIQYIREVYRANPNNFVDHPALDAAKVFDGKTYVLTHELDENCPKVCTSSYIQAFNAVTWEAKGFRHDFSSTNPAPEQADEYYSKIAEWISE